jgi:hypothetical protein
VWSRIAESPELLSSCVIPLKILTKAYQSKLLEHIDEVERCGVVASANETNSFQSSTPCLVTADAPRDRSNRLLGSLRKVIGLPKMLCLK